MCLNFFCLLFAVSLYGQTEKDIITVEELSSNVNYIYKFDIQGKLLEFNSFENNNNEKTIFKINYKDSLLDNVTIFRRVNSHYLKKYEFVYDKNHRLIAQKSSKDNDTIKFFYDSKGRINEIKNYYGNDIQNKYLESGNISEKISRSTVEDMSEYYDITKYNYGTDKIIEEITTFSPYGETKFIKTKEFIEQNLVKETSFYPTNQYLSPIIIEYTYNKQGFLENEISKIGVKKFNIINQPENITPNVIKKINTILLGDFKSIGWY